MMVLLGKLSSQKWPNKWKHNVAVWLHLKILRNFSFQNEIKMILSESVCRSQNAGPCDVNQQLSRRRKELALFMGSLLEEMAKAEAAKVGISSENTSVLGK